MKIKQLDIILENSLKEEVKNTLLNETKEYYHVMLKNKPIDTFETEEDAKDYVEKSKDKKELLIDKKRYNSYDDMIDTLDDMSEEINENENKINMKRNLKEDIDKFEMDYNDLPMDEEWSESEMYEDIDEMSPHDKFMGQQSEEMYETDETNEDDLITTLIDKYLDKEPEAEMSEDDMCMECGDKYMEEEDDLQMEDDMDYDASGKSYSDYAGDGPSANEEKWYDETYNEIIKHLGREPSWHESSKISEMLGNSYADEKEPKETAQMVLSQYFDIESDDSDEDYDLPADLDETFDEEYMHEGEGMCNECGSMLNEEGMCMECGGSMKESKKRKIRLKESELIDLIKKMVNESIPGLTIANKSKEGSKKDSTKHYSEVDAKMKKYLKFEGNDNPEFPNQINKGEKEARKNTDEQESEMRKNFAGLENLEYDIEPSEKFKDRLKKAIEGDSTMGNGVDTPKPSIKPSNGAPKGTEAKEGSGNQIKTDTAKKIEKQVKDRKKDKEERVIYKKEKVPVSTKEINESKASDVLIGEIEKMKKLSRYNKRTQ